jgi:hypothetical protein
MLSKINKSNKHLGSGQIVKFNNDNHSLHFSADYDYLHDNLINYILVKHNKKQYLFDYKLNKIIIYNRLPILFNDYVFWKQIDSFDQNNIFIANKIRNQVLKYSQKFTNNLLGIGGEYYMYFNFINCKKYIGISNHKSIIEDANFNTCNSNNYLVNYNDLDSYPIIDDSYDVIINVYNLHENIIKYVNDNNIQNIIIISCNLPDNKLKLLAKTFRLKSFTHILNFKSWITIILASKII